MPNYVFPNLLMEKIFIMSIFILQVLKTRSTYWYLSILGNVHLELFHDLSHFHFIAVTFIYVHQLICLHYVMHMNVLSTMFFVLDIKKRIIVLCSSWFQTWLVFHTMFYHKFLSVETPITGMVLFLIIFWQVNRLNPRSISLARVRVVWEPLSYSEINVLIVTVKMTS